jgi:2'-5' RNA ligase
MTTSLPCYVVADIPAPICTEIQRIRDVFATPTATLPVEITLLGSSGLDPIPAGTEVSFLQDQVEQTFEQVRPWAVSFSATHAFPHTSIVYLSPSDRSPFDYIHSLLRASMLPVSASPFPYTPHCTLRAGSTLTPDQLAHLLAHPFPKDAFQIDSVSVYAYDAGNVTCELVCRKKLTQS